MNTGWKLFFHLALYSIACCSQATAQQPGTETKEESMREEGEESLYPDTPIPLKLDEVPDRPRPLLELGDPFLATGEISSGVELPTGAVWQPSLLVFGNFRTAVQAFNDGDRGSSEWVNRLDLFFNLQLSGTERLLAGFRPLDQDNQFTGYYFEPDDGRQDGWEGEINGRPTTLFFEGEFGELFPKLDQEDASSYDIGFSIGRQPLFYQEGILIDDTVDAVGITRNNFLPKGMANLQLTVVYGWNDIDRNNNKEGKTNHLFGFFSEADIGETTANVDIIYVLDQNDRTDGFFLGASAVQRIRSLNTAFRVLASFPTRQDTPEVDQGELLFTEISWTPPHSENILYFNAYLGIDHFSSAARAPDVGGPLGRTGILFAAVGLGRYPAPLGNRPDDSTGASLGYQMFFSETRKQLIIEGGGRAMTRGENDGQLALAARYQQALGQHTILRLEGFFRAQRNEGPGYGARTELAFKF